MDMEIFGVVSEEAREGGKEKIGRWWSSRVLKLSILLQWVKNPG